jgi:hypothetical protein
MSNELVRMWKEAIVTWPRYYSNIYLEVLRKTTNSVRISTVPFEIRTEHHPNINQERTVHQPARYNYVIFSS